MKVDKGKQAVPPPEGEAAAAETPGGTFHPYPKPQEKYEDVVADPKLFMSTLEDLHATMGTKFMVPIIGGKELNLHQLFKEVTSRGGIEKVIADRRWREVTLSFSFPPTATNASFVLRKYYMSLLRHYEQVYFFRSLCWTSQLIAPQASSAVLLSSPKIPEPVASHSETPAISQKRKRGNDLPSSIYPPVVGVIDGKFDHGYFATVTVGSQKLRGVLYPCPEHPVPHIPLPPGMADNSNTRIRRRRRRKKLSTRDPTHPKPNRSGYNFFFKDQHARLKPLHPGKDREISRMIGDLWNNLTEDEKAVYQERGLKDRERYMSEMVVYRERKQGGPVISNAVPIQQRAAEPHPLAAEDTGAKADQNDSSAEETDDSEGKNSDEGLGSETSVEESQAATDSNSLADLSTDGGFELRRREDTQTKNQQDLPSVIENEPKKIAEPATDHQEDESKKVVESATDEKANQRDVEDDSKKVLEPGTDDQEMKT